MDSATCTYRQGEIIRRTMARITYTRKIAIFVLTISLAAVLISYRRILILDYKHHTMLHKVMSFDIRTGEQWHSPDHGRNKSFNDANKKINIILFHRIKWWEKSIIQKYDPFEHCPVRCNITTDVKKSATADVVILQVDTVTNPIIPEKKVNQIWILSEFESPRNMLDVRRPLISKNVLDRHKRKFNWTMGYRRDADFVVTHGRFIVRKSKDNDYSRRLEHLMKTKNKTSTWFNSHCHTRSSREKYGKILMKHTQLDIFGTCGKVLKECNPGERFKEAFGFNKDDRDRCMDFIDEQYKFFMSFENSLCWDYVTEKSLQRIMPRYIVPVVRTYANHTLFHPPGSVVDTSRFDSVEKLGNYLSSIDNDSYKAFYSWRKYYDLENMKNMWMENVCRICKRSYRREKYIRVYEDIRKWILAPNGKEICKAADDLH